jgi:hypothetical protein
LLFDVIVRNVFVDEFFELLVGVDVIFVEGFVVVVVVVFEVDVDVVVGLFNVENFSLFPELDYVAGIGDFV